MYYKVLKDNKVIDVLDHLTYVRYVEKNKIMIACTYSKAQAIVSSDGNHIWHVKGLYHIPVEGYDTVELIEIDKYEFEKLKALNGHTPEEIIDSFVLSLIEGGIL